jgi:hypothetical protein
MFWFLSFFYGLQEADLCLSFGFGVRWLVPGLGLSGVLIDDEIICAVLFDFVGH